MKSVHAILLFSVYFFPGCGHQQTVQSDGKDKIETDFDKLALELTDRYDVYQEKFGKTDSIPYSVMFELTKRIYLPDLKNLTLDFREYIPCGGCWIYRMAHIYNDSISFLLPLTDDEIYWRMSFSEPEPDLAKYLNFEIELNNLTHKLDFDKEQLVLLIDEIMRQQAFYLADKTDLPKFKMIWTGIEDNDFYNDSCRTNLKMNLEIIEEEFDDKRKLLYSNDVNVMIFNLENKGDIAIRVINKNCSPMMLY